MKREKQEPKAEFQKWLKIENTLNDHRQPAYILCRSEIELKQTTDRYNLHNYILTVFDSDPRNVNLRQRKSFR